METFSLKMIKNRGGGAFVHFGILRTPAEAPQRETAKYRMGPGPWLALAGNC